MLSYKQTGRSVLVGTFSEQMSQVASTVEKRDSMKQVVFIASLFGVAV
jgi:hypothetical protein